MDIISILQSFKPLSLDELNSKAKLMEREETKYLTTKESLLVILKKLAKNYNILMIEDKRIFDYENMYMDYKNLLFFLDHENAKEQRVKVRKRQYVNSNFSVFEYKLKTGTSMDKKSIKLKRNAFKTMDKASKELFEKFHGKHDMRILPTMQTTYKRITLCNKITEERVTIDLDLVFTDPKNSKGGSLKVQDFVIIEVKQKLGAQSTTCHNIIKNNGGQLASGCSKYCLGLIYFDKVKKHTHFQKTVDYINKNGGVRLIFPYTKRKKIKK
jgi:VTC domain